MKTKWDDNLSMLKRMVAVSHTVRLVKDFGGLLVNQPFC